MASKTKSRKGKSKTKPEPGSKPLANAKWELFAHLYSGHHSAHLFGNGTQCYALAYGYTDKVNANLDEIQKLTTSGEAGYTVKVKALEAANKRMKSTASVEAARILVNPSIRTRCDWLLSQGISDDFADRELQFVIAQRTDLNSKVAAIKERNRVKGRVNDNNLEGRFTFAWEDPEPIKK